MSSDPRHSEEDQPVGTSPRMRDQPALTTSSGRIWLIMAALFGAAALLVLVPMLTLEPAWAAPIGIVAVVVLYGGVILARVMIPPGRRRLGVMAACMLAMAAISLLVVLIVAFVQ